MPSSHQQPITAVLPWAPQLHFLCHRGLLFLLCFCLGIIYRAQKSTWWLCAFLPSPISLIIVLWGMFPCCNCLTLGQGGFFTWLLLILMAVWLPCFSQVLLSIECSCRHAFIDWYYFYIYTGTYTSTPFLDFVSVHRVLFQMNCNWALMLSQSDKQSAALR